MGLQAVEMKRIREKIDPKIVIGLGEVLRQCGEHPGERDAVGPVIAAERDVIACEKKRQRCPVEEAAEQQRSEHAQRAVPDLPQIQVPFRRAAQEEKREQRYHAKNTQIRLVARQGQPQGNAAYEYSAPSVREPKGCVDAQNRQKKREGIAEGGHAVRERIADDDGREPEAGTQDAHHRVLDPEQP